MKLHKCPECDGKREIQRYDKYDWCPECDGTGYVSGYKLFMYWGSEALKIILFGMIMAWIIQIMMKVFGG